LSRCARRWAASSPWCPDPNEGTRSNPAHSVHLGCGGGTAEIRTATRKIPRLSGVSPKMDITIRWDYAWKAATPDGHVLRSVLTLSSKKKTSSHKRERRPEGRRRLYITKLTDTVVPLYCRHFSRTARQKFRRSTLH